MTVVYVPGSYETVKIDTFRTFFSKMDGHARGELISQKVFMKSFRKSQFPHKSVNVSLIITNVKNKLTGL